MPHRILLHIDAVNLYYTLIYIVKTRYELHKRCLCRTRLSYDSDRLTRLYVKGNVGEDILLCLLLVFEIYMVKFNLTALHTDITRKLIRYVDLLIEHLHYSCT